VAEGSNGIGWGILAVSASIIAGFRMGKWYGLDMVGFDEPCLLVRGAMEYFHGRFAFGADFQGRKRSCG
jgi:hypothetical protein